MFQVYLYALVIWFLIIVAGIALRRRKAGRILLRVSYAVFILFCVEFACVLAFYIRNGRWTYDERKVYMRRLFEPHPYMVGVPRKSVSVTFRDITYTHNAEGFRGKDFAPKSSKVRVAALGGSTTYGANVNDGETWPVYLESMLGPDYEVLNFGVIGHGTIEHINMAALALPEHKPDVLIVHAGLNDLRNMHIRNLAADYSDYHAPTIHGGMGFCSEGSTQNFASVRAAIWGLKQINVYPRCVFDDLSPREDDSPASEDYARYLFKRNLTTLVAIAKRQGLKPLLVPQILIRENLGGDKLRWWIPFVSDDELPAQMSKYNEIMREVAKEEGLHYAREVLDQPWVRDDFVDPSHLSAGGNLKLAGLLQKAVRDSSPNAHAP